MDVLIRIKRAVLAGRYVFSEKEKARCEMETDDLTEVDIAESITERRRDIQESSVNQSVLKKKTRIPLYNSKPKFGRFGNPMGKLVEEAGVETYYFLVSSKEAM